LARLRSPNRDKAFEMWKNSNGSIKLKDIAESLCSSEGTVRGWKNKDKWDDKLNGTFPKIRNVPKGKKGARFNDEVEAVEEELLDLSDKQKRFVDEYLVDLNATQAAIRAGYSPHTAQEQSSRMLKNAKVKAYLKERQAALQERVEIKIDDVLRELRNIATANVNDIMELRRTCCRYCWGIGFKFQMTANEMQRSKDSYDFEVQEAQKQGKRLAPFNTQGGEGYNAKKDPNDDCPECFGDGINTTFFKDTRKIKSGASSLYAGIKVTKDGLEVKINSKEKALELIGKHLGMFIEKVEVKDTTDRAQSMKRARERVRNGQTTK